MMKANDICMKYKVNLFVPIETLPLPPHLRLFQLVDEDPWMCVFTSEGKGNEMGREDFILLFAWAH